MRGNQMSEIQPAAETDAVAFPGRELTASGAGNSQLYRELKYRNKQLSKSCGKQGQTIYRLRAELAEVRTLNSKADRGELRRLERVTQEQAETIAALEEKLIAETEAAREESV